MSKRHLEDAEGNVMAEEGDSVETFKDFIINHVNHFYVNHIPFDSIKDMSDTYLYFFGTVAYIFSFVMFAYFFYENYTSSLQQAFISLQPSAGNCETVPIAIQANYLADSKGTWSSEPSFQDVKAQYSLRLTGFEISSDTQYINMMNYFNENLQRMGEKATQSNLAENLLIWMSYTQYYSLDFSISDSTFENISSIGQVQSFTLTGAPSVVFNLDHLVGRLGSASGICDVPSFAQFDAANSLMSTTWTNYTLFSEHALCTQAVYAENFGYYPPVDDNIFVVKLNVESFAITMAVNSGVLPLSYLTSISSELLPFQYGKVRYTIGEYFDLRYPTMRGVYCISNTSIIPDSAGNLPETLCFLPYSNTFSLPLFNPFGSSSKAPAACDCDVKGSGHGEACNTFNFFLSVAFFRNTASDTQLVNALQSLMSGQLLPQDINITSILDNAGVFALMDNVAKYPNYAAYNRAGYSASYYTAYRSENATATNVRNAYTDFCTINGGAESCSMVVFNAYDTTAHAVSPYKFQLRNGSCHNTIAIAPSVWNLLVDSPPVEFTQLYYECYDDTRSAIVAAIGIAQGNTQTFLPFFVVLVLPLLYLVLLIIREVPPKEEYKEQEKNEVNEILALLLLRLRDGKTRGVKKHGVLMTLAQEMIGMAKEEGGYPDSDDEDEEEEEEAGRGEEGKEINKKHPYPRDSDDEHSQSYNEDDSMGGFNPSLSAASSNYDPYNHALVDAIRSEGGEQHRPRSGRTPPKKKTPKTLIIQGNKVIIEDRTTPSTSTSAHVRNAIDQFRQIVAQRNRRKRMDVFTKHLAPPSTSSQGHSSTRTNRTNDPSGGNSRPVSYRSNRHIPSDRDTLDSSLEKDIEDSRGQSESYLRRVTTNVTVSSRSSASNNQAVPVSIWQSIFGSTTTTTSSNTTNKNSSNSKQQEMQDRPSLVVASKHSKAASKSNNNGTSNSSKKGNKEKEIEEKQKAYARSLDAYTDLTLYAPPQNVQILNIVLNFSNQLNNRNTSVAGSYTNNSAIMAGLSTRTKKELTANELSILLNDLVRYFSEALHAPLRADSTIPVQSNPLHKQQTNNDHDASGDKNKSILKVGRTEYRIDSVDQDVYHEITRRDHIAFQQQALPLSVRLSNQVNWCTIIEDYEDTDRSAIVLKLINIMTMHTSIEYNCEMSEVSALYGKTVAYNIGQRLVTLYLLEKLVA